MISSLQIDSAIKILCIKLCIPTNKEKHMVCGASSGSPILWGTVGFLWNNYSMNIHTDVY